VNKLLVEIVFFTGPWKSLHHPGRMLAAAIAVCMLIATAACGAAMPPATDQAQTRPAVATATPVPIVGIGVLGDSNSDEYRADDDRGGEYAATTYGWVELLAARRGLNFGAWETWDEPRRSGYAYNWARSGATAQSMIESGQHIGLAQQVASGQVSHVVVWIGTNDFATWNDTYQEIYDGRLNGEPLQAKIDSMVADMTLAVDTVLRAGKVKVLLVTIADRAVAPDVIAQFPDAAKRRQVSEAIRAVNTRLAAMAVSRGAAVVDSEALTRSMLKRVDAAGTLRLGSESIDLFGKGDEPHHGRLNDEAGHSGTIVSGLIANEVIIGPLNEYYGAGIAPLSDDEILQSAGLNDSQ
jgi:hypothetical protein